MKEHRKGIIFSPPTDVTGVFFSDNSHSFEMNNIWSSHLFVIRPPGTHFFLGGNGFQTIN